MGTRKVILEEAVGPHEKGATLEIVNVYGDHHIYDYKLAAKGTRRKDIEVTENEIRESGHG